MLLFTDLAKVDRRRGVKLEPPPILGWPPSPHRRRVGAFPGGGRDRQTHQRACLRLAPSKVRRNLRACSKRPDSTVFDMKRRNFSEILGRVDVWAGRRFL
jgi:hypothetical protein